MSKQAGTTKNVSQTGPLAMQSPYLAGMLQSAHNLYMDETRPAYFPGSTVAPLAEAEGQARNYLSQYASQIAAPMAERTQQSLERAIGGEYMDAANNPYVQQMVKASTGDVSQDLLQRVLPAIKGGAIRAGQLGGSRQGIAEGLAIGEAARGAQRTAADINFGAYNTGLNAMMQGFNLAPTVQSMGYTPADMLQAVGGQERAYDQAQINEQIARWQHEQNLPYVKLAEYANIVRSPMGGQTVTETQYPQTSSGAQIAGGAMTLVPVILQIGKALGWF